MLCACGAATSRGAVDPSVIVEDGRLVIIDANAAGNTALEVRFALDSADLDEDSFEMLLVLAEFIESSDLQLIEIQGHTDEQGPPGYNMRLSRERAETVKEFLVGAGIDASRLQTKGFGDQEPIARDGTDQTRAQNRRVEFVILE